MTLMRGFTLIELSITLVIIGLLVGGILVGKELISAATARAQIAQIEKLQTATNSFRLKYAYLPGDIPNADAVRFGFLGRGSLRGQGDGNGIIEGWDSFDGILCDYINHCQDIGEYGAFWVDLSKAKLIEYNLNSADPGQNTNTATGTALSRYFPAAKIKGYIYVWSGTEEIFVNNTNSYFAIDDVTQTTSPYGGMSTVPALTVHQAYAIDKKMDDGLPQYGNVIAKTLRGWVSGGAYIDSGGGVVTEPNFGAYNPTLGGPVTTGSGVSTPATQYTCYDNNNTVDATEKYSITYNNGTGLNCSLSFKFQ